MEREGEALMIENLSKKWVSFYPTLVRKMLLHLQCGTEALGQQ